MRFSEWLGPNCLQYWPIGILYRKSDLEDTTQKKKKTIVGNANLHFYSAHRWILRASELVSSFFQYSNLQHRANGKKRAFASQKRTCPCSSERLQKTVSHLRKRRRGTIRLELQRLVPRRPRRVRLHARRERALVTQRQLAHRAHLRREERVPLLPSCQVLRKVVVVADRLEQREKLFGIQRAAKNKS